MTEQIIQPIDENLWWVIPGQLAGVRQPLREELSALQVAGVSAIVSVFHEPSNLDLYQEANLPFLWLPIAIDSVPTPEQLNEFVGFVQQHHQAGRAVAVHCSTGRHRTGTLLAAYLIRSGASYPDAIDTLVSANPAVHLPTAQSSFLQALAQG